MDVHVDIPLSIYTILSNVMMLQNLMFYLVELEIVYLEQTSTWMDKHHIFDLEEAILPQRC